MLVDDVYEGWFIGHFNPEKIIRFEQENVQFCALAKFPLEHIEGWLVSKVVNSVDRQFASANILGRPKIDFSLDKGFLLVEEHVVEGIARVLLEEMLGV